MSYCNCQGLNEFLRSSTKQTERFRVSKTERYHLHQQLNNSSYTHIINRRTDTFIITKSATASACKTWKQCYKSARKEIETLGVILLKGLLEEYYECILVFSAIKRLLVEFRCYGSKTLPREEYVSSYCEKWLVRDQLSAKIANFPVLYIHNARTNQLLIRALEYIATYKFFEQIENQNPNPQFKASFFSLTCDDRIPGSDGYYDITYGKAIMLTFKILDTVPKYLVILNFNSFWQHPIPKSWNW